MRNALLILALILSGCSSDKEFAPARKRPIARYRLPNQFTMADGCIVRSIEFVTRDGQAAYRNEITVNSWSDECSEGKDIYPESEIVNARYK